MASLLEGLREGSFKNATFLIKSATTTGGRKQVKHEFPNSNKQNIEDLGFRPKNFKLRVITTSETRDKGEEDSTYFFNRDKLISALEQGGIGVLSHPFFTTDLRVVARPYSIIEDTTTLGVATFDLEFDVSDTDVAPQPTRDALSEINQKTNDVTDQCKKDIADNWFVRNAENLKKGKAVVTGFINNVKDKIQKVTQNINGATNKINEFNADIAAFQNDIVSIVQAPQRLADAIINTVQTTRALYATVKAALDVFTRMFDFGDSFEAVSGNTRNTEEQQVNQDLIVNVTGAAYLAQAYQSAAVIEYTSVDDVDEVKAILETQFDKISEADISDDLKEALADLRTVANSFLDEQRLTARDIIEINIKEQPIRVLGFANYGEDNNDVTASLININNTADISFLGGDVLILSAPE